MPRASGDSQRRGMQLPADFPHDRHEQHLVALPSALLTDDELLEAMEVVDCVDIWLHTRRVNLVCDLLDGGWPLTVAIARVLRLPPALFRPPPVR